MLNLFFPKVCAGCYQELLKFEDVLCLQCLHALPLASFHLKNNEKLKDKFFGRLTIENATALIYYQKTGLTQELMHNLKYRGRKEISSFFGKWLGSELADSSCYKKVEMVIPVPLHKQKLKKGDLIKLKALEKKLQMLLMFHTAILF